MNAPVLTEVGTHWQPSNQAELPLAAEGVLRYLWESKFSSMLIEVKDGCVYVNGDQVLPSAAVAGVSQRRWLAENQVALENSNAFVERHVRPLRQYRVF